MAGRHAGQVSSPRGGSSLFGLATPGCGGPPVVLPVVRAPRFSERVRRDAVRVRQRNGRSLSASSTPEVGASYLPSP